VNSRRLYGDDLPIFFFLSKHSGTFPQNRFTNAFSKHSRVRDEAQIRITLLILDLDYHDSYGPSISATTINYATTMESSRSFRLPYACLVVRTSLMMTRSFPNSFLQHSPPVFLFGLSQARLSNLHLTDPKIPYCKKKQDSRLRPSPKPSPSIQFKIARSSAWPSKQSLY
jgi:hypothetical protein